ncbi:MAG: glycine cleavage system protein T [Elusimicrobia bacterium RIFOXYB2_FULL_48_7]|nr:MAG: glycine cleavage system protein T [Elusimicrobia bacterium RIFOXYB2_FULL_48_7]
MSELKKTIFCGKHVALKANMVEFGGWNMPLHYESGIVNEHLLTRKGAGLFDVSHMGRFVFRGPGGLSFLQHVLTNNAAALEPGNAQYTIIPNETGGAIDDAYLYRFTKDEYILVVNAGNLDKDWAYFKQQLKNFKGVEMIDKSREIAMISLQGPKSKEIISPLIESGALPEPMRNCLSIVKIAGAEALVARTGYTGEPICFEFFIKNNDALKIWDLLIEKGAAPVGLGARDTLRLEAALPLYGHEFGTDIEGKEIQVFSCPLAKFAVSFSPGKGEFAGRKALLKQFEALKQIQHAQSAGKSSKDLPKITRPIALIDKGVARAGYKVFDSNGQHAGYITSGTTVPYYKFEGSGISAQRTEEKVLRPIGMALVDSSLRDWDEVEIEIRDRKLKAVIVPYHMRTETPPYARAVTAQEYLNKRQYKFDASRHYKQKAQALIEKAVENTAWRRNECVNLIPSEMTISPAARMLSIMDPAFRYAEHKKVKAFNDAEVFYYQGCEFIGEVEKLLEAEMCAYFGCREVEARVISGQMANMVVYSAVMDYINRSDRRNEQRRINRVFNNHIIRGGHLSGQPMGGLQDFVSRDPVTEKPAVVNFPVLKHNPYMIDVEATKKLLAEHKPELIIFGKSMVLHPEPVAQIRKFIDEQSIKCVIMYDMAHVLGLIGPHFQEPFKDGADIVTGSTHKTFFGTQRGIIASKYDDKNPDYDLWETIRKRTFPGSLSNHHLGTLLGLLMATYEMNCFKDSYQKRVVSNAKAFARALHDTGMKVGGDPEVSFTQTHQVILNIGYAKGPEAAKKLEDNNIIVNYQATSEEEGFTAAGSVRMGVSEMTRFGMEAADFKALAQLIHDAVVEGRNVKEEVKKLRSKFTDLKFCFADPSGEFNPLLEKLHKLI